MSLPDNTLSTTFVPSLLLTPDNLNKSNLVDYERGGVAIQNPSQGINAYNWMCSVISGTVTLTRDGEPSVNIFSAPGITEISFTFDQNMNPAFAYIRDGSLYLRWFDPVAGGIVTTNYGPGKRNPKLTMDDKRGTALLTNDILLAYLEEDKLVYRQQRDRFQIVRILKEDLPLDVELDTVGMSSTLRVYFKFKPYLILPSCIVGPGPGPDPGGPDV